MINVYLVPLLKIGSGNMKTKKASVWAFICLVLIVKPILDLSVDKFVKGDLILVFFSISFLLLASFSTNDSR